MNEYKGKISGQIEVMKNRAQSRILKVDKIKEKFKAKLAVYTSQDPVRLDFTAFSSVELARKEIFHQIFKISKRKSASVQANVNSDC